MKQQCVEIIPSVWRGANPARHVNSWHSRSHVSWQVGCFVRVGGTGRQFARAGVRNRAVAMIGAGECCCATRIGVLVAALCCFLGWLCAVLAQMTLPASLG